MTRHGKGLVAIVPLDAVQLPDRLRGLLSTRDPEAALTALT